MSMDHDDYATFARIEDHLRRIADALEASRTHRLPELLDIAQRGLDRVAASFRQAGSPDDSRLAMQDLAMELRAALNAKPCDDRTRTDRDHWAPRGPNQCDPGCVRPSLHDGDCVSDEEAQRILRSGQELGFVAEADPLDESDHRPRHFPDGEHLYRNRCGRWHNWTSRACYSTHRGDSHTLAWWDSRLTFCDCDDATDADGATD